MYLAGRYFFYIFLILGYSCNSSAAIYNSNSLFNLSLQELLEIKVNVASGSEEFIKFAPSSVTVFTRGQLQNMGVKSVEAFLNFVPGFQSSLDTFVNRGYRVGARGLLNAQTSYSILFLIDGQRMNSDTAGGALFDNRFIAIENIERIEIIRGPGSAMYGTNAFSGVVSIITTRDVKEVNVSAGSFGSKSVAFNTHGERGKWKTSGFLRYYDDDGDSYGRDFASQLDDTVISTQDPYTAKDLNLAVSWDDRWRLDVRHSFREFRDFFNFRFIENGVARSDSKQESAALTGKLLAGEYWHIDTRLSYSRGEVTQIEELDNSLGAYRHASSEWAWGASGELEVSSHLIRAGMEIRYPNIDIYDFEVYESGEFTPLGPTDGRRVSSVYVQDQYDFSSQLRGTLGLRVDHTDSLESSTNPRMALVYTPTSSKTFKLMYGEAFRAPNRFQTGDFFVGNSDLQSEKIHTIEAAWLEDWSETSNQNFGLQTATTLFFSKHKNRIYLASGDSEFGFLVVNDQEALNTSGLEFELSAKLADLGVYRIAYTYLAHTEEKPQSFASSSFSLIADYAGDNWAANISALYQSGMEQDTVSLQGPAIVSLDSHWLLNSSLKVAVYHNTDLVLRIYNLTNATYYSPSIIRDFETGIENRGRSFTLGIDFRF